MEQDRILVKKATVLAVDDTPANLLLILSLLKNDYTVLTANSGQKALTIAASETPPDLILLDIMMPGMDGREVCLRLKNDPKTRDIPVIFLTSKSEIDDEKVGLDLGAVDYIAKPINPPLLLARIKTHIKLKSATDFLRDKSVFLEQEVQKRTSELKAIQDVTIMALASLAETRDSDTGNHIRRTQYYVKALAERVCRHHRLAHLLNDATIDTLFRSAPLHDIGKVGIPDRILLKPGIFEPHEFDIMKTHTTLGRSAIEHAEQSLETEVSFLVCAKEIAQWHHEKWDGSGYPDGLRGENIPLSARLMAVADVYDALISRRIYKEGMPHAQAVDVILAMKSGHFDPDLVDAFFAIQDEFRTIAAKYSDSDADMSRKKNLSKQASGK